MTQTNDFNSPRGDRLDGDEANVPSKSEIELKSRVAVGILHSLSGTMAISEPSLKNAALMAIAEINQTGGLLGKTLEPVVVDGASNPTIFAQQAQKLIQERRAATIFGCWSSATRKALLPILESNNILLWYPVQYEGLECSPYIFYTGSCPNQQIETAVNWLIKNKGKRFYLIGSDYVFPRTVNKILRAHLKRRGGTYLGEQYLPLGASNFTSVLAAIAQLQPTVIFNTLNGDSNIAFYQQYQAAGFDPQKMPIMAASIAEEELQRIGEAAAGHYASWSYFQSLPTLDNERFVAHFKARYGEDAVTSDPVEAAYTQVYLWKQAVERAGSFETERVRRAALGLTFAAPSGLVRLDNNHHLWKYSRIGKALPTGQFEVVYDSGRPIQPQPWLGLEQWNGPAKATIIDLLSEVSQGIHHSCQVEENSRTLKLLMAELIRANQQLRSTQEQLTAAEQRNRELRQRQKLLKKRLSSQIRNSLDLDTILSSAVEEVCNLLKLDCCQFLWHSPAQERGRTFEIGACAAFNRARCQCQTVEILEGIEAQLTQENGLAVENVTDDPQLDGAIAAGLQGMGVQSILAAPVQTRSGRNGAIVCEQYRHSRVWKDSEIELLKAVVDQLAIAIDQAQLYEHSQTAAAIAQAQAQQLEQALHDLQETQAHLIQTEKMSALGMLVAGIAHEIKNPVGFICGNLNYTEEYTNSLLRLLQLYQQHYPQPEREILDYAEEIELDFLIDDLPKTLSSMSVGADRIQNLVLSLRNFSRKERGHMEAYDLHEGIESTLLILSNRLKASGPRPAIAVEKDYGALPLVECYPSQINQVLMNLLGNAIDVLEEMPNTKNKIITIRTEYIASDPSPKATIQIIDNGSGIPAEIQQNLFDPFITTKPIGKGTGLGLAIGRKIIVETHGGQLTCSSVAAEGTQFVIELPVSRRSPNPLEEPPSVKPEIASQHG